MGSFCITILHLAFDLYLIIYYGQLPHISIQCQLIAFKTFKVLGILQYGYTELFSFPSLRDLTLDYYTQQCVKYLRTTPLDTCGSTSVVLILGQRHVNSKFYIILSFKEIKYIERGNKICPRSQNWRLGEPRFKPKLSLPSPMCFTQCHTVQEELEPNHSQCPLDGALYFLKPLPPPQKTITSYIILSKVTHFVLVRVH